ncbi:UNVERIFIED_CONTAM: hypothetical protein Slati_0522200 [Sesamum latifolium]|uniref:Integrase catalytic domain-containing protein n=1 Tax=Sesamum latifolium TaxID=2727402 RepID=A0AAW2XY86_9LAMI
MIQYLQQIADLKIKFHHFQIIQIPREENAKADSLSKLGSSLEDCRTRHITIHYLPEARTPLAVQSITMGEDWRTPIIKWIEEGLLPENRWEAARLKTRATRFIIQEHILYKKSYTHPLLRCLSTEEGIHILKQIHSGYCGAHVGTRILANKALRAGYFWPTMKQDAIRLVSKCEREIISDNDRQFQSRKIQEWCQGLRIKQRFTTVAHPQANGQVEVTNRILVQGIKRRLERVGGNWAEELTSVLWAYRTTPRGSTGETPFSLVYGTEAIIPAELGMPSHRVMNFSEECNENLLRKNLDLIEELRKKAFLRIHRYKNIMINSYNKRVKSQSFQVGDLVLRSVDALKPIGKLDPTWEGPYKVTSVIGKGAYELEDPEGRPCLDHGMCTISRNTLRNKIPLKDHQVTGTAPCSGPPKDHRFTGATPLLRSSKGSPIHRVHPPAQAGPFWSSGPEEEGEMPSRTAAGAGGASEGPVGGVAGAFFCFSAGSPSFGTPLYEISCCCGGRTPHFCLHFA